MSDFNARSETRKLPVFASLGEVFSGVTRHYFQLLIVAWPAVIFLLLGVGVVVWQYYNAGMFQAYVANNGGPDMEALMASSKMLSTGSTIASIYAAELLLILASAVAAVRWHRFVLLGEGANGLGGISVLRAEDGRYIWALIKIIGFMLLAMLVVSAFFYLLSAAIGAAALNMPRPVMIVFVVAMVVLILWLYTLMFRLMLALPDASVGRGGRVFAVFGASAGNGWRLFALIMLQGIILGAVAYLIAKLLIFFGGVLGITSFTSPVALTVTAAVYVAIYLFAVMSQVTTLSVAYREIIGLPSSGNAA